MINVINLKSPSSSNKSTFNTSKLFPLDSSDSQGQYTFINDTSLIAKKLKSSIKAKRKANPKEWVAKELPDDWLELTKKNAWKKLKKSDKRLLQVAWPSRHFCLSYEELAKLWSVSRMQAMRIIAKMEKVGLIKKEHEYVERKSGETKIHKRNYYVCTDLGRAKVDELIKDFFPAKNSKMLPRKDYTSYSSLCQDTATSSEEKSLHRNPEAYHAFLETRLDEMTANEVQLKQEIISILELFGFEKEIPDMSNDLKKEINESPITKVCEFISFIREKVSKKFRLKNFCGFLRSMLRAGKKPVSWMTKKANHFMEAIAGKASMEGVDSSAVVDAIKHLQKHTGRKLKRQELISLLHYGVQNLLAALKLTVFKAKRLNLRNWVGFVHSVAKKSIIAISNMYKSEEALRQERAKEDVELARQNNMDDKSAWDNFFANCDEEPVMAGTAREIWDCG